MQALLSEELNMHCSISVCTPWLRYEVIILLYWCICSHLQYKQQYRNSMTKLFADLELKKQKMEEQESKDKKKQREEEDAVEFKVKKEKEWKSEWEVGITRLLHVARYVKFSRKYTN